MSAQPPAMELDLDALHAELAPAPAAHRARLLGLAQRAAAAPAGSTLQAWLVRRLTALRQMPPPVPVAAVPPVVPVPTARAHPLAALRAALPQRDPAAEPLVLQTDRRRWTRLRLAQRLQAPAPPAADAPQLGPLHAQVLVPAALAELAALSPEYLARLLAQWDQLAALGSDIAPEAPRAPKAARSPTRKPAASSPSSSKPTRKPTR
ncbi:hypothetical protein [Inhella gelatinilytica]|uniref:DUF2894 domain-containing protein n=1 Tax=Inhella gelatinilytica TaxID=2795030 RepID=A0A931IVK3_9BURK|nr:hypothetical protein [Inhella gelatinilytica]MBH9551789.1 hypothetical protein [Inhella gelatinilytica]